MLPPREMARVPENAKEVLKEQARKAGAVVCGVAAADAFDPHAPAGYRPGDLLPEARAVVVVGGAAPRAGDWVSASSSTFWKPGIQCVCTRVLHLTLS